jgi:hypothetical protein
MFMTKQTKSLVGLAVLAGSGLGWLALTQPDGEMMVVGIAAAAFLLAYLHDDHAWVWAMLVAGSLTAIQPLAAWSGLISTPPLDPFTVLNHFIPAFLGAYLAVMVNWSLAQAEAERKAQEFMGTQRNSLS